MPGRRKHEGLELCPAIKQLRTCSLGPLLRARAPVADHLITSITRIAGRARRGCGRIPSSARIRQPPVDYALLHEGAIYFERQARTSWSAGFTSTVAPPAGQRQEVLAAFDDLIKEYPHSQYVADAATHDLPAQPARPLRAVRGELLHETGPTWAAAERGEILHRELRRAPAVQGSMKVLCRPYTGSHDDLAKNARTVYVDNYRECPGCEQKKAWWRRIL